VAQDIKFTRSAAGLVGKVDVPQLVFPNGATGATLTQTQDVTINGAIKAITVGLNNNTGNATVTLSITDEDGAVLFTKAAFAENTADAPTVVKIMNDAGDDVAMELLCAGVITITALISGDPGASTGLCDVTLYCD